MKIKVIERNADLKDAIDDLRKNGNVIGFVPTMGALHEGHLSLIKIAQSKADVVVCSIFVNPTQFDEQSDLDKYPRTLDADIALLESVGCDFAYAPSVEDVYGEEKPYSFDFDGLSTSMEGAYRDGHFEGVVQVVKRLFELVNPDLACFGLKDYQQYAIIRHMSNYFNMGVEVVGCPIVREPNGLAMSSRNTRLSEEETNRALTLSRALIFARDNASYYTVSEIKKMASKWINTHADLEYFEIADAITLQPIENWEDSENPRAFVAAKVGRVRLIDNMEII